MILSNLGVNRKMIERGFITIAAGDIHYCKLAWNLLRSYRIFSKSPLPFAILCDDENEYTKDFDQIIVSQDLTASYIDKLLLWEVSPFQETVFLDADCLAYADLNELFNIFEHADDFSCLGKTIPLESNSSGWFSLDTFPDHSTIPEVINKEQARSLRCSVDLHGGLYYFRKTEKAEKVFQDALSCVKNYSCYRFRTFDFPADEPAFALAMELNDCRPIPYSCYALCCFWQTKLELSVKERKAFINDATDVNNGMNVSLVHWGTRYTKTPHYKRQIAQLNHMLKKANGLCCRLDEVKYSVLIGCYQLNLKLYRLSERIIAKLSKIKLLKTIWHKVRISHDGDD